MPLALRTPLTRHITVSNGRAANAALLRRPVPAKQKFDSAAQPAAYGRLRKPTALPRGIAINSAGTDPQASCVLPGSAAGSQLSHQRIIAAVELVERSLSGIRHPVCFDDASGEHVGAVSPLTNMSTRIHGKQAFGGVTMGEPARDSMSLDAF